MTEHTQNEEFINPIDEKKITENPSTLPYAHTVGGFVIQPTQQGQIKGKALSAMQQQTEKQMNQLHEQMQTLAYQAQSLQKRTEISKQIYQADIPFEPVIGHTYYVYLRKNGKYLLSLVNPNEWGKKPPFRYIAEVYLLADHTWEVLNESIEEF
jgi:Protein of unknown function (DUF2452)